MRQFLILTVFLMLAACGPGRQYAAIPGIDLTGGQSQHLQVYANGDWRDTGVRVERKKTYIIHAAGRWTIGGICGYTDASGAGVSPFCAGDPLAIGVGGSALIGRIGSNGKMFGVGTDLTFKASESGVLYLRGYDMIPDDNSGFLQVSIKLQQPLPRPRVASTLKKQPLSAPRSTRPTDPRLPTKPLALSFVKRPVQRNDVAVIIGNADYKKLGKDIPDVVPAYADAESFKRYATSALGIRPGNIIELKDATSAHLTRVFGSKGDYKGQLFDWVRPGRSRVYVYYAGHGAPASGDGSPYLVPVDADTSRISLNGYALETLYANLNRLPAKSITVVLEACFSGASPRGNIIARASGIYVSPKPLTVPPKITVIAAGAANQMASWEEDSSHGLFTKYLLNGWNGKADAKPYGNGDGKIGLQELEAYLQDTLTYYARRYYGRDQTVSIVRGVSN